MSGLDLADTKTGAQLRPCGQTVFEYLKTVVAPEAAWVFPSPNSEGPVVKVDKALKRICDAAGLAEVTCHTLRHSFGTVAGELNYSDFTIGTLLGHSKRSVTGRYVHAVDHVIATAANHVSSEIAKRMGLALTVTEGGADKTPEDRCLSKAANSASEAEYLSLSKWRAA